MHRRVDALTSAKDLLRLNVLFRRAQRALSQEALAERSGVSRAWISKIESGTADPGLDVISRIATALGVPIGDLFREFDLNEVVDDEEILRRRAAGPDEFVDGDAFIAALDESTAATAHRRYSRRGRRPRIQP